MVRWRGNHEIWCWEWLQDRGIWTQTEDASYGHLLCALDPEKTVNVYHKYDPKTSLGAYALKQWLRVDWMAKRSRWTKDAELIVWNHKRHVVGFDNSGENKKIIVDMSQDLLVQKYRCSIWDWSMPRNIAICCWENLGWHLVWSRVWTVYLCT